MALTDRERKRIPVDLVRDHSDPFYNECRAYGRLVDKSLNGKVAVRCHGYMAMPAEREEELKRNFNVDNWNRPADEYAKAPHRRQPFRAIIKDLITEDISLTGKVVKIILKDLKRMRKVGVYPTDVQASNYRNGMLLDFSVALTEPHYLFVIKASWRVRFYKRSDLVAWQTLVRDQGFVTWERAVPSSDYCKKLRSHSSEEEFDN